MANNRLYLADSKAKEYIFINKGFGAGWDGGWFDASLFEGFISERYNEGEAGGQTYLFFFTEYHEMADEIFANWTKFE